MTFQGIIKCPLRVCPYVQCFKHGGTRFLLIGRLRLSFGIVSHRKHNRRVARAASRSRA